MRLLMAARVIFPLESLKGGKLPRTVHFYHQKERMGINICQAPTMHQVYIYHLIDSSNSPK